jgi:hypothetical protein
MGEKTKSLSKIIILSVVFSLLLFTKVNAAILFEDDFNDGVADGWNEFSGTWSVINFEYVETNQSVGGETFTGHPNWTSYIYEARIKRGDGDEDNDFGLIFYAQSTEDYLRFTIWSDYEPPTPRITHIRPEPNPCVELATVVHKPDLVVDKWYDVKLVLYGNTVSAYVDGVLTAYSDNLPFDHGYIGLSSDYSAVLTYFDDVKVAENLEVCYLGDLNYDRILDISDVILELRIVLCLDFCGEPLPPCADINGDGIDDISDVILKLRMALGLDPLRLCTECK